MPHECDFPPGVLDRPRVSRTRFDAAGLASGEGGRAYGVDGSSYFTRSGPRVVTGVEILAGLLHPDRVGAPAPEAVEAWPKR